MTLVVAAEPHSLVAVHDQCATVEAWAEQCDSVAELRDASNKLAAISEYLERTSTEGRGRVAAAQRRLEVRIGKLLGPANLGHDRSPGATSLANEVENLTPNQRHAFRQLAENEDAVEAVIASSNDDKPATRNKVIRAIKDAVAEERARQAQRAEDRAALTELAKNAEAAGFDMDPERVRQRGEFNRLCRDLAALPAPAEFLAVQGERLKDIHFTHAEAAFEWLHDFHQIREAQ